MKFQRWLRALLFLGVVLAGCGAAPTGGPIEGAPDDHCEGDGGLITQTTSQDSCHPADTGTSDDNGPDYGTTHYGTAGYDDDCKYYVSFTVTPVTKDNKVTFVVTATDITTGAPLKGADMMVETTLGTTHAGPAPTSTEGPDGTYTVQPFAFDASGDWTVRFHFFEDCEDTLPDSPHGHAAFYIRVP